MASPPPNPTGSVYGSVPPPYPNSSPFPPPRPARPKSTNTALIVVCILGSLGVAALLFAYGVVKGMGGIPLRSAGTVSSTPQGITYTNPSQNIRVAAPSDWTAKPDKDTLFFFRNKEGCSVMMLEAIDVEGLPESQQRLLDIIRKKHPEIQTSFTQEQIAPPRYAHPACGVSLRPGRYPAVLRQDAPRTARLQSPRDRPEGRSLCRRICPDRIHDALVGQPRYALISHHPSGTLSDRSMQNPAVRPLASSKLNPLRVSSRQVNVLAHPGMHFATIRRSSNFKGMA